MSIEINISNYESYLLSYIDGELNAEELAALELFLQKHPQFRQELELLEGTKLVPDRQFVFDNKAALYKTASVDYETLMLGYIDGELTTEEEAVLQAHLQQHPAARQELALFQATRLTPDTSIVFKDKASLYRSSKRRVLPMYRRMGWVAAAAAVVAGLVIWLLPAGNGPVQQPAVAVNTPPAVTAPVNTPAVVPDITPSATPGQLADAAITKGTPAVTPKTNQALPAKRSKTVTSPVAEPATKANEPVLASADAPKTDLPVISQLAPQRNSMSEVVEEHLQQAGNAHVAARPDTKETVLAANTTKTDDHLNNKIVPTAEQPGAPGELIISVSGSDSRILDKVTNVAKFFSRKRNK
ncbi:zf-HC2 domain-containing protein [Chitinophaga sp. OAE865]|uniref:anti-sigma factor family protein n=1 Tax=Chitinophaga sp. OAE865 TaxID=2817898 RepID=UPI001AE0F6C1